MLAKSKLNSEEFLISKDLIDSYIIHDEIISINNVLKKHIDMIEKMKKMKNLKQSIKYFKLFIK